MPKRKDPAAVLLGRRGGKVGGKSKNPNKGFGSLDPAQRKKNAKKAAMARWKAEKGKAK